MTQFRSEQFQKINLLFAKKLFKKTIDVLPCVTGAAVAGGCVPARGHFAIEQMPINIVVKV